MKLKAKEDLSKFILLLFDFTLSNLILLFSIFIKEVFGKYSLFFIKTNKEPYFHKIWWASLLLLLIFFAKGLYSRRLPFWEECKEIFTSMIYIVLISFSVIYLKKMLDFPRSIFIFYFVFSILIFPISRHWFKLFLTKIGLYEIKMLIIGAGVSGKIAAEGMIRLKEFGVNIVGFLDDFKKSDVQIGKNKFRIIGKIENLETIVKKLNIDTIMIAIPSLGSKKLAKLTSRVQLLVKRLYVVPESKGVAISNTQIYNLFYEQIFLLRINNNLQFFKNRILKNLFDFSVSIAISPFLLVFIFICGILIKIDSKGPIFFVQDRLGKNGKIFKCIKFRTMFIDSDKILKEYLLKHPNVNEEWIKYRKIRGYDPRVTRIGKILRKTSLDELPQIFNVLLGEMSLVGPRPYLPKELEEIGDYRNIILSVIPGITGLWQVSGRNMLTFEKRLELDAWYVLNWSLWLDITIIFKTLKVVLKREGAY